MCGQQLVKLFVDTYFYFFIYKNPSIKAVAVGMFRLFISTCFRFFAYKNYNAKTAISVAVMPIVKAFLFNISLAIFIFSIAKIAI